MSPRTPITAPVVTLNVTATPGQDGVQARFLRPGELIRVNRTVAGVVGTYPEGDAFMIGCVDREGQPLIVRTTDETFIPLYDTVRADAELVSALRLLYADWD